MTKKVCLAVLMLSFLGLPLSCGEGDTGSSGVPSGSKIAFASDRDGDGNNEIYAMNADGTNLTRLADAPENDANPSWSADGTQIAFQSQRRIGVNPALLSDIYVMNADGTNLRKITNKVQAKDYSPAWSPDGTNIFFSDGDRSNIYVMDANGTSRTRLTETLPTILDVTPSVSPNGTRIAFVSDRDGNTDEDNEEIYLMDATGTNQTRLTESSGSDVNPSWSPDGTKIAFSSNRDGGIFQIYVMNADGTNPARLTNDIAYALKPSWSPGGTHIAFASGRDGNGEIYVMNADGSNPTNITNDASGTDSNPSWSPQLTP
jgi:Tol biopolymer transport system component